MTLPVAPTRYMDNPSKAVAKKTKKARSKSKSDAKGKNAAPSAIQKAEEMTGANTFVKFPELPTELKVMVWKEAFKVCWVHRFSAFEMGTMRRNKVKYLIRRGGLGSLLYVDSLSRRTVLEAWKKWVSASHEGIGTPCSVGLVFLVAWLADGQKLDAGVRGF